MSPSVGDLIRIRDVTLRALKALDGTAWRAANGELHVQYNEMPNWITIDAEADLRAAHRAFVAIFAPHFEALGPVNVTVAYTTRSDGAGTQRAFLDTNHDIRSALSDPAFGLGEGLVGK